MYTNEEFIWGGLRTRLERMGRVRPHTIRQEGVRQPPDVRHRQLRVRPAEPVLGPRLRRMQPAPAARAR